MKLGRKEIKTHPLMPQLGNYIHPVLPDPPPAHDWTKGIRGWGMMLNDQISNCTVASAAHAVQVWTANMNGIVAVPDSEIRAAYQRWGGYDPANPASDLGGAELDVLNGWKSSGFAGHELLGFAAPDFTNLLEIRQSIYLFGGVYAGFALPLTSRNQDTWDVVPGGSPFAAKGSWGGHCVYIPKYDENSFTCISWGQLKTMTVAFWNAYCDEAHALLGRDWIDAKGSPPGFDKDQLLADLALLH